MAFAKKANSSFDLKGDGVSYLKPDAQLIHLFTLTPGVLCIDADNQSPRHCRSQRQQTSKLSPPHI